MAAVTSAGWKRHAGRDRTRGVIVEVVAGAVIGASVLVEWRYTLPRYKARLARGDDEWREQWRNLDPSRRRALDRAMRRGVAVQSPDDVELVVRADAQQDHVRRATRMFEYTLLPIVAAVLALGVEDESFRLVLYFLAAGCLWWFATTAFSWWMRRKRKQSVAASLRLHRR